VNVACEKKTKNVSIYSRNEEIVITTTSHFQLRRRDAISVTKSFSKSCPSKSGFLRKSSTRADKIVHVLHEKNNSLKHFDRTIYVDIINCIWAISKLPK
jgi:hypothetical protein